MEQFKNIFVLYGIPVLSLIAFSFALATKQRRWKVLFGVLLLESLISIALLAFLVSFIVSSLVQVRQKDTEENQKIEALNVAQMAIESHLTELSINGSDIKIKENQNLLIISNHGKEIMRLELQS